MIGVRASLVAVLRIRHFKHPLGSVVILAAVLAASPARGDEIEDAMKSGDYPKAQQLAAEQLKKDKHNAALWQSLGDANFHLKDPSAHQNYTQSWLEGLEADWDATKGDSKFWKFLEVATVALGAAADYQNARAGVQSTYTTQMGKKAIENIAGLDEATGKPEYRKIVKRVMADLKASAKRPSSSLQVVKPNWSNLPGAAMARVHAPEGGVCNAVRYLKAGQYLVSADCLKRAGATADAALTVSIGGTLLVKDFARVEIREPIQDNELEVLHVQVSDATIATETWRPKFTSSEMHKPLQGYAVTWYAPEFEYIVPLYQECTSELFNDCGNVGENGAILWVEIAEDLWIVHGFATADGRIVALQ